MNFFMNKFSPFLFIMWFSCVCCLGCIGNMPWQKTALISYQTAGPVLFEAKVSLTGFCESGVLDEEQCAEAKEAYNTAVSVYKLMGNQLIIAMDSGDDSIYQTLSVELSTAIQILTAFVIEGGAE